MQGSVINLKTGSSQQGIDNKPESSTGSDSAKNDDYLLEWEAYESIPKGNFYWYLVLGVMSFVLIMISLYSANYFFAVFMLLASVMFVFYTRREPKIVRFYINSSGIGAGRTFYKFSQIKSFWIFEYASGRRELSLEVPKPFVKFITLPLADDVELSYLRQILRPYTQEKEHELTLSDAIGKMIGF